MNTGWMTTFFVTYEIYNFSIFSIVSCVHLINLLNNMASGPTNKRLRQSCLSFDRKVYKKKAGKLIIYKYLLQGKCTDFLKPVR